MNYIVWKVTRKDFEEVAKFLNEEDAKSYAEFATACTRNARYEVTKAGETPVW